MVSVTFLFALLWMPTGCPNVMLLQEPIFQLQEPRMFCIANFSSYTPGLPPNSLSRLGSTCSMYNTWGCPALWLHVTTYQTCPPTGPHKDMYFKSWRSTTMHGCPKDLTRSTCPTLLQDWAALHGFWCRYPRDMSCNWDSQTRNWCSQRALGCTHSDYPAHLRLQALDFGKKLLDCGFWTGTRCVNIYIYKKHLARRYPFYTHIYIYICT